jgi:H+/gluconate symporter-like permease
VLGTILAVVAAILGLFYLNWQVKRWKSNGEHFVPGPNDAIEPMTEESRKDLPSFFVSFIPVLIIFFGNLIGTKMGLNSTFAVCISIFFGTLYIIAVTWGKLDGNSRMEGLNKGATSSLYAIMNTAAIVGFAGAVKTLPAFTSFTDLATSLKFSPLLSAVLAMDIICAITASSSGGITIFMELLGQKYLDLGVNAQVLHRLTAVAAGTLDSLPHAGPNATFMSVCGLTYKEGYFPIFVVTCIIPLICQFLGLGLAALGVC